MTDPLVEPPFLEVAQVDVQWGDVDRMQHVNNVVYFRWLETARTRYFERLAFEQLAGATVYPILASVQCNYRAQVRYPDRVRLGFATVRIGTSAVAHAYRVESEQQQRVVATGLGTWVCFDYAAQKPIPLPATLRQAMETVEGRSLGSG